jgi:hypothetical protein
MPQPNLPTLAFVSTFKVSSYLWDVIRSQHVVSIFKVSRYL